MLGGLGVPDFLAELPLTTHVLGAHSGPKWRSEWCLRTEQLVILALLLLVVRFYLGLIILVLPNTKDCA